MRCFQSPMTADTLCRNLTSHNYLTKCLESYMCYRRFLFNFNLTMSVTSVCPAGYTNMNIVINRSTSIKCHDSHTPSSHCTRAHTTQNSFSFSPTLIYFQLKKRKWGERLSR